MSDTEVIQEHQRPFMRIQVKGKWYRLDHGKRTAVPADVGKSLLRLDGIRAAAAENNDKKAPEKMPGKTPVAVEKKPVKE